LSESIRKDAKSCLLHGVTRKATPKPMNRSLEESGRNGRQGSLQKSLSKKALIGYEKKNVAWIGTTVGTNRKIFC
jgi:hypothetical protein